MPAGVPVVIFTSSKCVHLMAGADVRGMWLQANRTADDVAGFVDIILTQALSMANTLPDIANPLEVIGEPSMPSGLL